ncbi:unnamed protein product [Rhizophagus irregularis]|uniref:DUF7431 domain-containing protein n=1 Tax=Rhizophagus irregularis TaxID=588596 RepID=A0A916EFD1_9GLOM|nr:unnamed protein product [Rhizophagus irregularis]CAB5207397.1 unnamed protein product [Rhizophagus irregularis]CAB5383370.1 unnamed protein product [Rhizophagus irregularis]
MNDTLSFANKINNNDNIGGSSLADIAKEDEEKIILKNIIDKGSKTLYLKLEPDWKFFKDKLKLEYGRAETLEKANKRAFTIVGCEMNEVVDGYENSTIQIGLKENKIIKNDFLLIVDIDIPNFAKFGVSVGNSNIKNSNVVTNLTYSVIEYNKMSLKFKLEPTIEFIEAVKDVIDSKDPRMFKNIIKYFGQFIPKEVILGGRVYFIARENSEENVGEYATKMNGQASNIGIEKRSSKSLNKNNSSKYHNLRKQILSLVGKRILFTSIEDYSYKLPESGSQLINISENILEILQNKDADCNIFATIIDKKEKDVFSCQIIWSPNEDPNLIIHCIQKKFRKCECKLKIKWMVVGYDIKFDFNHSDFNVKLKVLKNEFNISNQQAVIKQLNLEYDSSVLCFGIPVLSKLNSLKNSLVIGHHFINDRENRKVGTYIFSYCLEKNHYVNLPKFTFYTLIISNYPNTNNYGMTTFQQTSKIRKLLNFIKVNSKLTSKFISLYSIENDYEPIFLKQKTSEIEVKHINVNSLNCDQNDCICKSKGIKGSENNLKYAFLDPKDSN